ATIRTGRATSWCSDEGRSTRLVTLLVECHILFMGSSRSSAIINDLVVHEDSTQSPRAAVSTRAVGVDHSLENSGWRDPSRPEAGEHPIDGQAPSCSSQHGGCRLPGSRDHGEPHE